MTDTHARAETASQQLKQRIRRLAEAPREHGAPSDAFAALALEVFQHQAAHNALYARYLELLRVDPASVRSVEAIPFVPIELFKHYSIQTGQWLPAQVFTSSGTMGQQASRHLLKDPDWYRWSARLGFSRQYGRPVEEFCFLALLPSYLEREGSSLVAMMADFIEASRYAQSGFYLRQTEALLEALHTCRQQQIPTVLLGVSFALLDLAEAAPMDLSGIIVMETGGMKGRRAEITREELHRRLCQAFQTPRIHSEYGMTELLSQAYAQENGLFRPSPTMAARCREATDPFQWQAPGRSGALNIIDLANVDTISFIATDDLGKAYPDGSFEVLGRLDHSDIRGCNLMVE